MDLFPLKITRKEVQVKATDISTRMSWWTVSSLQCSELIIYIGFKIGNLRLFMTLRLSVHVSHPFTTQTKQDI